MKKIVVLALCVTMLFSLVGCGDSGSESTEDLNAVMDEMKKTDSSLPQMSTVTEASENAETTFAVLADFDYSKIDKFIYSYSETGSPEEIAIICVKEKASTGDLMKALQAHIDSRRGTFQAYSPEKVAIVDDAVLTYQDKYVLLAIAPSSGAMQDVFKGKIG